MAPLLRPKDAATLLACSTRHLRTLEAQGELVVYRRGHWVRVCPESVERFVKRQASAKGATR